LARSKLFGADDDCIADAFFLCVFELPVEFSLFVIEFGCDAPVAELLEDAEGGPGFIFTQVEEKDFCAGVDGIGKAFEFFHDVVDPGLRQRRCLRRDAGDAKGARQVVIAAAAADAAHLDVERFLLRRWRPYNN